MKVTYISGDGKYCHEYEINTKLERAKNRLARLKKFRAEYNSWSTDDRELWEKRNLQCCGVQCGSGEAVKYNKEFNIDKEIEELERIIDNAELI